MIIIIIIITSPIGHVTNILYEYVSNAHKSIENSLEINYCGKSHSSTRINMYLWVIITTATAVILCCTLEVIHSETAGDGNFNILLLYYYSFNPQVLHCRVTLLLSAQKHTRCSRGRLFRRLNHWVGPSSSAAAASAV